MKIIPLLALLLFPFIALAQEPDWAALNRAKAKADHCLSFDALFELADSDQFSGADPSEALSEANEEAFLNCPIEFMNAFKKQPAPLRKKIVEQYFGIMHEEWELGVVLSKLQHDPNLADLINNEFKKYLDAKAPFEK